MGAEESMAFFNKWASNNLPNEVEAPKAFEHQGSGAVKLFVPYCYISEQVENKSFGTANDRLFHLICICTDIVRGGGPSWSAYVHIRESRVNEEISTALQVARSSEHHPPPRSQMMGLHCLQLSPLRML
jgi:hypothetical protein